MATHEKPIAAAVRYRGRIYTGLMHALAWEEAGLYRGNPKAEGFLTNEGRFVSRKEAARLVGRPGATMYSEEL